MSDRGFHTQLTEQKLFGNELLLQLLYIITMLTVYLPCLDMNEQLATEMQL